VAGTVLVLALVALPARSGEPDPRVSRLVDSVSEERLGRILERLATFETRHTLSATDSPTRGIGAARQFILEEMQRSSPRLQVSFDTYQIPKQGERITHDTELRNVMAILPGRSERRLYVSGHYDSVARLPSLGGTAAGRFDWTKTDNPAPGVDDDGSGTALVMELARAFGQSGVEFDATLVFIVFAGEEQGLVGARLHAQRAAAEKLTIEAVLNNDIVGGLGGGDGAADNRSVRVFSEGPEDSPSREIARAIRRQAATYLPSHEVRLVARHDRFGRGGDHTAFNQNGYPGVRFTEARENYSRQHAAEDTLSGVSPAYLARNAKVNAAALAVLALAPPAPSVLDGHGRPLLERGSSGYDATLRWNKSPGAVGYRVFWRRAWAADWEYERDAGSATEAVFPGLSIDDWVFGVAALGSAGEESLASVYVTPLPPVVRIETK
jgi:Peptidase family M28